ncbi:MAG: hypothetical protein C4321_09340, partial [Chloroflexota bacterium]
MALPAPLLSAPKPLTFEEYLRLSELKRRYDIVNGELIMSPVPLPDHQWLVFQIARLLDDFVRRERLGVILVAPMDVLIRKRPRLQTRQPDVLFLSAVRTGVRGRRELRKMRLIEIAPDLVIEIL